ncbi:MAG: DUF1307 domain-containing protein [Erysipelotrichaceae bacterium]|nr:DUF1307 domain-containing protein [Erysipelotrichaceae bacterium]
MKKLLVVLLGVLLLSGCGSNKTMTCSYVEEGLESTVVFTGKNDDIYSSVETLKVSYALFGDEGFDMKEDIKAQLEASYAGFKGLSVTVDISDDEFLIMTINLDYKTISKQDLVTLGFLSEGEADVDYISFEESIIESEAAGYICVVK